MRSIKELVKGIKRGPSDCTGVDVGTTSTRIVRLRAIGDDITVVGADIIPPSEGTISIPLRLRARYASIAASGSTSIAKLLTFPGAIDESFESGLGKSLGLADADENRVSYRIISEGQGRQESRVLAAAISEEEASAVMKHFASGLPAPWSLEVAPLAALTAFEMGPVRAHSGTATGLLDFGTAATTLSLFNRGELVLVRRFDFGTDAVLERVKATLGVDAETAKGILSDTAFDISELLVELMSPVSSQFVVSRDFIERRENCTVGTMFAIGGIAHSKLAMQGLEQALNVDITPWNPFLGLIIAPQAIPDELDDQHWRFAAALGAALGTMEEA